MDKVAKMLLRAVAIGIGVEDEDFFLRFHSGNNNQLRLLHYPPILAADLMDHSKARMPAHTDWGTITLSFQDDCGGLQVGVCSYNADHLKSSRSRTHVVKETSLMFRLFRTPSS